MTLEDFFTLTEMKDGLTAPSRVQELVSVMQKEQDCVVKNAGDATRQWAAVASTITATENKDCLDLFIQLDGLWFINRWLKDAQNLGADNTSDGFIEESITAMLRAVEKLYLDSEKSISSGILATVSNLLGHHSSRVQDRARVLFDRWKGGVDGDAEPHDNLDLGKINNVSDKIVREEGQSSSLNEAGNDDDHASQLAGGEKPQLGGSDSQLQEKVSSIQIQSTDNALQSSVSLDCEDINERSNHVDSVLTSVQEVATINEGETTSAGTCNLPVTILGSFKRQQDDLQLNDSSKKEKQDQNVNGPPEELRASDISSASAKPDPEPVSIGDSEAKALESVKEEPALERNVESNENVVCPKIIVSGSMRMPASDGMTGGDDVRSTNSSNPQVLKTSDGMSGGDDVRAINSSNPQVPKASENDDDCCSKALQGLSVDGSNLEKHEMSFLKTEYVEAVKEGKGQVSDQDDDTSNGSDSFNRSKGPRSPNIIDKSSDMELEYGIVDALEVARLVAQEVERECVSPEKEGNGQIFKKVNSTTNRSDSFKWGNGPRSPNVVDKSSDIELEYGIVDALEVARQVAQEVEREVCSSSSEKISEGGIRQPASLDSIGRKDEVTHVLPEEVSSRQSNSAEACSEEAGHMSISDNIEAGQDDLESSQVTEAARDPGGYSERSLCTFDLNEEVASDDMDVSVNAGSTMPIPVVSASKPAQTSGLPTTPLQFEGTLGWKGSAATSAFRPASPRKNSDSEKNVSVGGNSEISKQRHDCLDFDLNVVEGEEGLAKQIGEYSGLPSGQSSVELSPKRSSRFELDLNSIGDDGDAQPSDQRMEGPLFSGRNGYWSPSPASSSSSMQPSVRNIDLNDRPYFQTDLVDQGHSKSSSIIEAYKRSKSDVPVISILGAKVEVGRREHVPQTLSLPNGKAIEPAMDLPLAGAGGILGMGPTLSYNHPTAFGYNGLTSVPALSFSSAMYGSSGGPIPYMVDSGGTPVVPQVGGSSSTVLSYTQPPFIVSMTGTQLGLNGIGSSRPNFDLNSGFTIDGGNRDMLTARQFFFPAQGRAMEEHVRTLPQSSSSGVGVKRKEPDSGWETYPFSYKHQQPPWK
ncbi:dentin sialophosphoprotein [Spatholobus suberectus]|nr:dentin sialophosphoprotein [Spatholobus suberectus]